MDKEISKSHRVAPKSRSSAMTQLLIEVSDLYVICVCMLISFISCTRLAGMTSRIIGDLIPRSSYVVIAEPFLSEMHSHFLFFVGRMYPMIKAMAIPPSTTAASTPLQQLRVSTSASGYRQGWEANLSKIVPPTRSLPSSSTPSWKA